VTLKITGLCALTLWGKTVSALRTDRPHIFVAWLPEEWTNGNGAGWYGIELYDEERDGRQGTRMVVLGKAEDQDPLGLAARSGR
jgi:hypothetical protein